VYDGQSPDANPYADFNSSGNLTVRYLFGPGAVNGAVMSVILARTSSGGTTAWYLTDMLGSVRDIISTAGTVLDHVVYDSFGNIVTETNGTNGDRLKFAGMELDSLAGQYYDRARTYNPGTGKFTAQDPMGFTAGSANLYGYVGNGPTDDTDPSGMDALAQAALSGSLAQIALPAQPQPIGQQTSGTLVATAQPTQGLSMGRLKAERDELDRLREQHEQIRKDMQKMVEQLKRLEEDVQVMIKAKMSLFPGPEGELLVFVGGKFQSVRDVIAKLGRLIRLRAQVYELRVKAIRLRVQMIRVNVRIGFWALVARVPANIPPMPPIIPPAGPQLPVNSILQEMIDALEEADLLFPGGPDRAPRTRSR
jgi:RHS repeat-associated protein